VKSSKGHVGWKRPSTETRTKSLGKRWGERLTGKIGKNSLKKKNKLGHPQNTILQTFDWRGEKRGKKVHPKKGGFFQSGLGKHFKNHIVPGKKRKTDHSKTRGGRRREKKTNGAKPEDRWNGRGAKENGGFRK